MKDLGGRTNGTRRPASRTLVALASMVAATSFASGCKSEIATNDGAEGQFGTLSVPSLRRSLLVEFKRASERGEPVRVCVSVPDATNEADAAATVAGRYVHSAVAHALRQWFEASRGLMGLPADAPFLVALRATATSCVDPGARLNVALPSHEEIVVVTGKDEATFPQAAERAGWSSLLTGTDPFPTRNVAWAWPRYRTIVDRRSAALTRDPDKGTYVYLRRMMTHEVGHLMGLADTYRTFVANSAGAVVDAGDRGTHMPSAMQITTCYDGTGRQALLLDAPTDDDKAGLRSIADFLEGRTTTVECPADRQRHRSSNSGYDFCVSRAENVPSHVECPKVTDASGAELNRVTASWREAGTSGNDHSRESALRAFGPKLDEHLPYFDCDLTGLERCLGAGGGVSCFPRSCRGRATHASIGASLFTPTPTPRGNADQPATSLPPSAIGTPGRGVPATPGIVVTPQSSGAPMGSGSPTVIITPLQVR